MSVQVSAIDLNRKSVGPDGWRRFGWLVIGTGVFVVLAVFGRWTIIDQQAVSMIWPAAGVCPAGAAGGACALATTHASAMPAATVTK